MTIYTKKNKKGFAEITSFALLTLVVIIAATTAYTFSKSILEKNIIDQDKKNMEIQLKKLSQKLDSISNFQDSTTSMDISFNKGKLMFKDNQVLYQSQNQYGGGEFCINIVCTKSQNELEVLYINLKSPYNFAANSTFTTGSYTFTFTNLKNESKIVTNFQ